MQPSHWGECGCEVYEQVPAVACRGWWRQISGTSGITCILTDRYDATLLSSNVTPFNVWVGARSSSDSQLGQPFILNISQDGFHLSHDPYLSSSLFLPQPALEVFARFTSDQQSLIFLLSFIDAATPSKPSFYFLSFGANCVCRLSWNRFPNLKFFPDIGIDIASPRASNTPDTKINIKTNSN